MKYGLIGWSAFLSIQIAESKVVPVPVLNFCGELHSVVSGPHMGLIRRPPLHIGGLVDSQECFLVRAPRCVRQAF
jgi:hypothetical protein